MQQQKHIIDLTEKIKELEKMVVQLQVQLVSKNKIIVNNTDGDTSPSSIAFTEENKTNPLIPK
jgi:hypothetical protein